MFHNILKRKNAFLECKDKKTKQSKKWDFSKGVSHGLGQNLAMLTSFNLKKNRPGKCVLRYFRKEKGLSKL